MPMCAECLLHIHRFSMEISSFLAKKWILLCFVLLVPTEFVYLCVPLVAMETRRVCLGRQGSALKRNKVGNARITLWRVRVTIVVVETQQCFLCVLLSSMSLSFMHSFHWHVQNAMIPCRPQELLPFFSIMYFFLPPFSTNYSFILPHFIFPSISWSTSQSCCSQIRI